MALKSKCDIFLFLFVEMMKYLFRIFVYDTSTLQITLNVMKFEVQTEYFKIVFIIIIIFSKNGVKDRLKGIFQT